MSQPPLNAAQAQLLMSQLADGELSPSDAARLDDYLAQHPDALDWLESIELSRSHTRTEAAPSKSLAAARDALEAKRAADAQAAPLAYFPKWVRPFSVAAAAAVAAVLFFWQTNPEPDPSEITAVETQATVVEFVSTDIENASTYVIPDTEENGWTIVWVEADPEPTVES